MKVEQMKPVTLALFSLLFAVTCYCQDDSLQKSRIERRLPPPPPGRERSTELAPLRGMKDLRPKQFPVAPRAASGRMDITPHLNKLPQLKVGERITFPVASINPLDAVLVRKQEGHMSKSYSFRVANEQYKGAFIFITAIKSRTTGQLHFEGQMIRRGYSDALKLKTEGGKMYFAVEAHENVVQD